MNEFYHHVSQFTRIRSFLLYLTRNWVFWRKWRRLWI